ncbi:MAG TPA: MATE family efflux transporter [Phycisphaerae bacterium]|nr:MATE family efflux transporter [Phycisphaerae bacterium]HNU44092.1 MATE family efflux transporter [Phycisphaerae bacterium]
MRIAFLPTIGVGHALTALVGKSIGAGQPERALREARIAFIVTTLYMGALSALYLLWGGTLIGWFNDSPEVVRIGAAVMVCAAVFQLFDAAGITYSAALRGAGDTFWPALFFVGSQWSIIVGGGFLAAGLWPQWGSLGPWWASATLIIVTALFLWWRWRSRAWMKIDIFRSRRPRNDGPPTDEPLPAEHTLAPGC